VFALWAVEVQVDAASVDVVGSSRGDEGGEWSWRPSSRPRNGSFVVVLFVLPAFANILHAPAIDMSFLSLGLCCWCWFWLGVWN